MSDSAPPRVLPVEQTFIADDVHCISCGYNLRMLQRGGLCPECGTQIERSMHGDLLRLSDPTWVAQIARGTTLACWGLTARVLLYLGIIGAVILANLTGSGAVVYLILLFALPGFVTFIAGIWLATTPAPNEAAWPRLRRVREACRTIPPALIATGLLAAVAASEGLRSSAHGFVTMTIMVFIILVSVGIGVWSWCFFGYFSQMGARIPSERMQKLANGGRTWVILFAILAALPIASLAIVLLGAAFETAQAARSVPLVLRFPQSRAISSMVDASGCVGVLSGLSLLFVAVYVEALLRCARREFDQAAKEAEENWCAS